jgi:hypothetical protein
MHLIKYGVRTEQDLTMETLYMLDYEAFNKREVLILTNLS